MAANGHDDEHASDELSAVVARIVALEGLQRRHIEEWSEQRAMIRDLWESRRGDRVALGEVSDRINSVFDALTSKIDALTLEIRRALRRDRTQGGI